MHRSKNKENVMKKQTSYSDEDLVNLAQQGIWVRIICCCHDTITRFSK